MINYQGYAKKEDAPKHKRTQGGKFVNLTLSRNKPALKMYKCCTNLDTDKYPYVVEWNE